MTVYDYDCVKMLTEKLTRVQCDNMLTCVQCDSVDQGAVLQSVEQINLS